MLLPTMIPVALHGKVSAIHTLVKAKLAQLFIGRAGPVPVVASQMPPPTYLVATNSIPPSLPDPRLQK